MNDMQAMPFATHRPTAESISAWIVARLAEELQMAPCQIDIDRPLTEFGLSSMHALSLTCDLVDWLGCELPADLLWKYPTVARVARHLASGSAPSAVPSPLVALQAGGRRPPLILVPPAATSVFTFSDLVGRLGTEQPIYGLEPLGLQEGDPIFDRIEEMATVYVRAIEDSCLAGPYCLAGRCFGGSVALEVAQQLTARGHQVALLAILDTHVLGLPPQATRATRALYYGLRAGVTLYDGMVRYYQSLSRHIVRFGQAGGRSGQASAPPARRLTPRQHDVLNAALRARGRYVPRHYPGRFTLFRAAYPNWFMVAQQRLAWSSVAGKNMDIHVMPGDHFTLDREPHVAVLAARLRSCLDAALDAAPRRETASACLIGKVPPTIDRALIQRQASDWDR
jgi:thioesterase domain-containing protein/acyl carrier protein